MISSPDIFLDSLLACAVCVGGDDATTTAANLAIGFLGVIILSVLGGILKFMHYLSRQQKLAEANPDPLADLAAEH
jgi:hypothetical protein